MIDNSVTNNREAVLAQELGELKKNQFTKDELLYLKDAAQKFDDPKFSEDLQEGVFIKILYLIDAAEK